MAARVNVLGEYLQARRQLITPEQVGLAPGEGRRVPGLRREELAMLAGISADYYLRLERGRDRHPSPQVLAALAHALQLEPEAEAHLLSLVAPRPRGARRRPGPERVPDRLRDLVTSLPLPAFIEGRFSDILFVNPLATALSPRLVTGANRLRSFFLDPEERDFYQSWGRVAPDLVAGLRESIGTDFDLPEVVQLVGELSLASEEFRQLWARHDVKTVRSTTAVLVHPVVGALHLHREKLWSPEGLILVVWHPKRHTDTTDRLGLLASFAAADAAEPRRLDVGAATEDPGTPTTRRNG